MITKKLLDKEGNHIGNELNINGVVYHEKVVNEIVIEGSRKPINEGYIPHSNEVIL